MITTSTAVGSAPSAAASNAGLEDEHDEDGAAPAALSSAGEGNLEPTSTSGASDDALCRDSEKTRK
ncbi:MAG: hypothetical protein ABW210_11510 [Achromobacter sp.]